MHFIPSGRVFLSRPFFFPRWILIFEPKGISFQDIFFGSTKIRKKDKLLFSKHGLNAKLKIPQKLVELFQFFQSRKLFPSLALICFKYIQKIFPTSVLGTA